MSGSPTPVEVFYSYAHKDESFRAELEKHLSLLRRQGIISAWHDRHILPGTNWAQAIDEHLEQASIILLLVSADFLASDYCYGIEMQRALQRHQAKQARVIPILLRPVDWHGAPFAHLQALPTNAKAISTWKNRDQAFADVAASLRRAVESLSLQTSAPRAALPPVWNVPYPRNTLFIGREALLVQLRQHLQAGQATALSQPQAISGLGGIGKTQLAVEYAYRYRQDYQAVLWARAETTEALASSYVTFASLLNLPEREAREQEITVQAVKTWLQTHSGWLLILDNADDLALAPAFLPPMLGGHLLLTTRAQAMGRLANRLEVDTLSPEQGALFLLRRAALLAPGVELSQASARDQELAVQISQELGGLPLALDQAGAYLEETGSRLADYQQLFQQHRATLLRERRGLVADHPESVAMTWSLSFARVEERNPAAADLLRCCAYLAPDAIPEEIITQGAAHLGPQLALVATDALLFGQVMEALRAYSLIGRDSGMQTLSVHRLVQAVLQGTLEKAEKRTWAERAILAVNAAFPESEHGTWPQCERLLPHALLAAHHIERNQIISEEAGRLLHNTALYLYKRARYQEAEPLYQHALRIREQQLRPEHPDVVSSLHGLAALYWRQGKYAEAEPLYQRALRIREQQLGPEHPNTATSLACLAALYNAQGKYEQAERLYQRALCIWEQQLDPEHSMAAYSLNGLARLYQDQGKYEQAEPLYQRALRIRERRVTSNPNDAVAYLRRGYMYLRLKKRDSACADFARSAALQPENVNTAWIVVYAALGKQHPGREIAQRLETIAAFDPQSDVAMTCVCRGVALGLCGKLQEGLTELEQALHLNAHNEDAWFWKGMMHAYLGQSTVAMKSIEQALRADLPPILLTPLYWLEQDNPHFYQEYAEPLLKRYGLA